MVSSLSSSPWHTVSLTRGVEVELFLLARKTHKKVVESEVTDGRGGTCEGK